MPKSITTVDNIFEQLTIPQSNRFTSVLKGEGEFMHNWVKDHQIRSTLEIGLAYGASAACIVSAHDGLHTCIDPYQQQNYQNTGLKNLETCGYLNRVVFHQDFSHNVLPKLLTEQKTYDFIFIDGGHHFDNIFVDFYYADLLLAQNGYILLHDAWLRSTQLVTSFVRRNRANYKQVRGAGANLILFKKSGETSVTWDHFIEFYTMRGIVSHKIIITFLRWLGY